MAREKDGWRESRAGHVYLAYFRVRFSELDPMGHVNNAVYLNWMEQAAIDHATLLGFGRKELLDLGGAFIARRHEIDYLMPALSGDVVRVTTWPESMSGARAFRCYEITRVTAAEQAEELQADGPVARDCVVTPPGDLLTTARTEWAYVNFETGRPMRLPAGLENVFLDPVERSR